MPGCSRRLGNILWWTANTSGSTRTTAYDFSVLGNTPITFPIEWDHSKIPGYAVRATRAESPRLHGVRGVLQCGGAFFHATSQRDRGYACRAARSSASTTTKISTMTAHLQYQPWKTGPWFGFNWRYDSGLVAGPVPCAGGNCENGPVGTIQYRGRVRIDAGSAVPGGAILRQRARDADHADQLHRACVRLRCTGPRSSRFRRRGLKTTITIRRAIAPRSLFDVAVGDDNLFHGDRYKWSLRLTAINVTNKYALYNFLSTFSGTHYVTPRSYSAELGFHF